MAWKKKNCPPSRAPWKEMVMAERKIQMENSKKLKELDEAAYKNQPMPYGLHMPETYYFLCVRSIYAMYRHREITREQAEQEKRTVRASYASFELAYRVGDHDMKVLRGIQKNGDYYKKDGCPKCKALYDQLCGLEIETEDEIEV